MTFIKWQLQWHPRQIVLVGAVLFIAGITHNHRDVSCYSEFPKQPRLPFDTLSTYV